MIKVKLDDIPIGEKHPVYIIAEAGVNHNGDMQIAKKLIEAAKDAGADAVKFQSFKAENLNTQKAPKSTYHIERTGDDNEQTWFELLKTQEISEEMHLELIDYCRVTNITFLSTPYDIESADLLDKLNVPFFKIASTDANNIPMLKHIALKGKPVILSTAMCTLSEVTDSYNAIRETGNDQIVLLHCTANYPSRLEDSNLRAINTLKNKFNCLVGYSDHSVGVINPVAAVSLGSAVYEKHFTIDKNLPGPDHRASLEPHELKQMVRDIRQTEAALGGSKKNPLESEAENRIKLRKSIVANVDLLPGQLITEDMISIKRPATGLPPSFFYKLIGKKVKNEIVRDTPIRKEDIESV